MVIEAETLRRCVARVELMPQPTPELQYRDCGESIAQVGETWEHVEDLCIAHRLEADEQCGRPLNRMIHRQDLTFIAHEFRPKPVQRGHQAIPGEAR